MYQQDTSLPLGKADVRARSASSADSRKPLMVKTVSQLYCTRTLPPYICHFPFWRLHHMWNTVYESDFRIYDLKDRFVLFCSASSIVDQCSKLYFAILGQTWILLFKDCTLCEIQCLYLILEYAIDKRIDLFHSVLLLSS